MSENPARRRPGSVLPEPSDRPTLASHPDSITRRLIGDPRTLLAAGYALALQVSHPTVSAGVVEWSEFKEDPWARLIRTVDFVNIMAFGTPLEQRAAGKFVRDLHTRIQGTRPDGRRYYALEPEAYGWVHASLGYASVHAYQRLAGTLTATERDRFWKEWIELGQMLGIRDRGRDTDLPACWSGVQPYVDWMIANRLEKTPTVVDVLQLIKSPTRPPIIPHQLDPLWSVAKWEPGRMWSLMTAAMLPGSLRQTFDMNWTPVWDDVRAETIARTVKLMPANVVSFPRAYRALRDGAMQASYLSALNNPGRDCAGIAG